MQGALLAALLFGGYQASGLCLARLALPGEGPGVRLLVGSVWGSVLLQWLPALLAFAVGFTPLAQWLGLGIALALAAGALAGCRRLSRPAFGVREALSAFARRKFLWVVLGVWAFFCFLVWHSFRWEGGAVYSSQATYGDMSMHLSFLTSLAHQGDFPPDYSLLPGTRLSYPFLSDSISASLYQLGAPLWFAYQLPMWAAGAQVLFGLYAFFSAMTESRAQAALAWVFFAFNGGFGFFYFLGGGVENFTRIFTAFYETPTNLVGENIRWVNVLVDMMLPQRATLFGWAVLFPALYLLCRAVYQGQRRCFFLVGLMAGALPMIHTHSFLALGLVCGVWLAAWLLGRLSWEVPAARAGKPLLAVGLGALALCKELFRDREDSPLFLAAAGAVLGCSCSGWAFWWGRFPAAARPGRRCSPGACCWRCPWRWLCPSCVCGPSSRRGRAASSRDTWAGPSGRRATCSSTCKTWAWRGCWPWAGCSSAAAGRSCGWPRPWPSGCWRSWWCSSPTSTTTTSCCTRPTPSSAAPPPGAPAGCWGCCAAAGPGPGLPRGWWRWPPSPRC